MIGVLYFYWLLTWDAVDAESAGRSGDASPKHSWVTGWFQAEVLETANSYWPLTSAGSLNWNPRTEFSSADGPSRVAGSATWDAEFS